MLGKFHSSHMWFICICTTVVIFSVVCWYPTRVTIHSIQDQIHHTQIGTEQYANMGGHYALQVRSYYADTKILQAQHQKSKQELPNINQSLKLTQLLTDKFNRLGVLNPKISVLKPKKLSDMQVLPIDLTFICRGAVAFEFLSYVESLPRVIHINDFHMSKIQKTNKMTIHMSIGACYFPNQQEIDHD